MIFVTLGSQKFSFDRLLKKIDNLIVSGTITEEVFAQTGYSDYVPVHYAYRKFLDGTEFREKMKQADTVITHGGTEAIINAVKAHKIVIAVPRQAAFGEHVDDHQKEIVREFGELNYIQPCMNVSDLDEALIQAGQKTFSEYRSNTDRFLEDLDDFLKKKVGRWDTDKRTCFRVMADLQQSLLSGPCIRGGMKPYVIPLPACLTGSGPCVQG